MLDSGPGHDRGDHAAVAALTSGDRRRRPVEAWALAVERDDHGLRDLHRFLADEVWPQVPADVLGKPLSRAEREAILGYGPLGL